MKHVNARLSAFAIAGSALAAVLATPAFAADATQQRLENADAEPQNWLLPMQNYSSHRYVRLDEINRDNVANLHVAFTVPLNDVLRGRTLPDQEGTPLVDDGAMFLDTGATIMRVDVSSGVQGVIEWAADFSLPVEESDRTRGVAMWNNAFYRNLTDGRVVAVDRNSGEFIFDKQIARVRHEGDANINAELTRESFRSTPLVAADKVFVANGRGDDGTRGWIAALDPATGDEVWRFYTVPAPGEPGHETWKDDHDAWKTGGAAIWTIGSYDAAQRLYIQGTAQPVPMFDPEFRPGDNLFSNSALALNVDDGTLKWYYQYTPNESWDYDEQGVHMLVDAPYNGTTRQMVVHFGRNGFYYQLDRTTGEFLSGTQYVGKVTWTAGLDPKTGLPVEYDPNIALQTYVPAARFARADEAPKQACPAAAGGARWQTPAYDPVKMIAYSVGEDGCQTRAIIPSITLPDGGIDEKGRSRPGSASDQEVRGRISAMDVTTGKMIVAVDTPYPNRAGGTLTSGGLLFSGEQDGRVTAYNSDTLEVLWQFYTGVAFKAPPMSYAVNGKQYVAILAGAQLYPAPELGERGWGSMLYVFTL